MEAFIKTARGQIKVEGDDQKDLWKEMAAVIEVFDEAKCGLCGCTNIQPVVRKNKAEEEFFEYQCRGTLKQGGACRAYLALGQNKKGGGLFPIRKLTPEGKPDREKGNWGPHQGWSRYRGEKKEEVA